MAVFILYCKVVNFILGIETDLYLLIFVVKNFIEICTLEC